MSTVGGFPQLMCDHLLQQDLILVKILLMISSESEW